MVGATFTEGIEVVVASQLPQLLDAYTQQTTPDNLKDFIDCRARLGIRSGDLVEGLIDSYRVSVSTLRNEVIKNLFDDVSQEAQLERLTSLFRGASDNEVQTILTRLGEASLLDPADASIITLFISDVRAGKQIDPSVAHVIERALYSSDQVAESLALLLVTRGYLSEEARETLGNLIETVRDQASILAKFLSGELSAHLPNQEAATSGPTREITTFAFKPTEQILFRPYNFPAEPEVADKKSLTKEALLELGQAIAEEERRERKESNLQSVEEREYEETLERRLREAVEQLMDQYPELQNDPLATSLLQQDYIKGPNVGEFNLLRGVAISEEDRYPKES